MNFDFDEYPTLLRMAMGPEYFKCAIGPAGCLPPGSEIMTPTGWARLDLAGDEPIALVYDPSTELTKFEKTTRVVAKSTGFYRFRSGGWGLDLTVSPEHMMWTRTHHNRSIGRKAWDKRPAIGLAQHINKGKETSLELPCVFGVQDGPGRKLEPEFLLLVVMAARTHHKVPVVQRGDDMCEWPNLQPNQVDCLREWMLKLDKNGTLVPEGNGFVMRSSIVPDMLAQGDSVERLWATAHATKDYGAVLTGFKKWWAYAHVETAGYQFKVSTRELANVIQYVVHAAGFNGRLLPPHPSQPTTWAVTTGFVGDKMQWATMRTIAKVDFIEPGPQDLMFCLHTSTQVFIVRQAGKIYVTGNSAKTTGTLTMAFADAMMQAPDQQGVRRTKTAITRQTYLQLARATTASVRTQFGPLGMVVSDGKPPRGGIENLLLPDGTRMNWELEFFALDSPNAADDALGLEATNVIFDEVSTIESEKMVLDMLSRLGRYPSKMLVPTGPTNVRGWGATNGPTKGHWLHHWWLGKANEKFREIEQLTGKPFFGKYQQPPALLKDSEGRWIPNPKAENIKYLQEGYNYYYKQLARDWPQVQAYVLGEFADLSSGQRVYQGFTSIHELDHQTFLNSWGGRGTILLSFDFGRTPVCLLAARRPTGALVVFGEVMAQNMDVQTFVMNNVKPFIRAKYPEAMIGEATGDPSGVDKGSVVDLSPFAAIEAAGISIHMPLNERADPVHRRITAVRQRLAQLDFTGTPMLQVTTDCPFLLEALKQTYVYPPLAGKSGETADAPTKSHVNWVSDLANALEYFCVDESQEMASADPVKKFMQQAHHMATAPRPMLGG